jgi:2-oxoisovalerate dehydrogenase E1 component
MVSRLPKKDLLLTAYRTILRARYTDEKIINLYKQSKCHFQIGCAGHEAVQVAAAQVFRPGVDWYYPYYRDMALCIGSGMSSYELLLNALNRQDDPSSHGRQMPMHYGHKDLRIVSQSSPTGSQFLQAVGCALATQIKGLNEVTYVSSGEGACAQGDFHEALNWAARAKLPIVFLIENNDYAISVHVSDQLAGASVFKLAQGYEGLLTLEVDGTAVEESYAALFKAHAYALSGRGPALIEAHVPRLQSHSISDNQAKYREEDDLDFIRDHDPLIKLEKLLLNERYVSQEQIEEFKKELKNELNRDAERAEAAALPQISLATSFTFDLDDQAFQHLEGIASGEATYLVDGINHVLDQELERNADMIVFGQDVADGKGGVFTVTAGLTEKYGKTKVFNAPLAESSIIGVAIGLACRGLRVVPEIQFADFIWNGMNQLRNELAMISYRSAGDWRAPVVLRVPVGGYIHGGCYHSQNIEGTFAHFPGLVIIYPSNTCDATGLLRSALRGNNPVLFLEHKGLYRQPSAKSKEGDANWLLPIGKAKVVKDGEDLTIVSWGALLHRALEVAKMFDAEGYSIEVIDLRSIVPLDVATILTSLKKSGRLLIVHEDTLFMGFAAEISAIISEVAFQYLDAPIKRVGKKYCSAVPHSPILEAEVLPKREDIEKAVREILKF